MANNPDVDLSGLSATELVEGLRVTLRSQQLTTNQQALMQEIARRTEQWGSMQAQLQAQSTLLSQLQSQLQNLTVSQQQQQQQPQQQQPATLPTNNTNKLERPNHFFGEPNKLNNWLFSLEQYFVASKMVDSYEKADFAATLLDGRAITWWRGQVASGQVTLGHVTWRAFERLMRNQFVDVDMEFQLRRKLYKLVQTKSVGQYVSAFRNVVLELGTAAPDEQNLLFQFVEGLKSNIRTQVLVARPKKLSDAMQIAERTDTAVYLGSGQRGGTGSSGGHTPMELGKVSKRGGQPIKRAGTPHRPQQQFGEGNLNVVCWYCEKEGHV